MQYDEHVDLALKSPSKVINKLSIPIAAIYFLLYFTSLIDTFWASGLNSNAFIAIGLISPSYLLLIGVCAGMGAGANSLVSRCLGARRFERIDNIIIHSLIATAILSLIIAFIGYEFLDELCIILKSSAVSSYCIEYAQIIFFLNIVFLLSHVITSIFRAEGDIKRATVPLVLSSVLNIILDPIFMYVLNWGVFGAGVATVVSAFLGLLLILYWIFIKKDTLVNIDFSKYKMNLKIYKDLLIVSIPAALEEIIYAITIIALNILVIETGGLLEVYSFTIAWKIISLAFFPCLAVGISLITVSGIAYGAKNSRSFSKSIIYATLLSLGITLVMSLTFYIFSYPISEVFCIIDTSQVLPGRTSEIVKIMVFFNFLISLGSSADFAYQGIGQGFKSLSLTILREIILTIFFAYLLGIYFNMGIFGVYLGAVIGINIGSIFGFICIWIFSLKFKKQCENESEVKHG